MNEQERTTQEAPPAPTENISNSNESVQKVKQTADKMQNIKGWSWGAGMLTPIFLIGTKQYMYLLVYLIGIIPVFGQLVILGFQIYIGLNAKTLIERSSMFSNEDEKVGFMKGLNHAGFISFIISIILLTIFFLFFLLAMIGFSSMFGGGMPNIGGYH